MTAEETRKNHFARLNNYRHSAEYAEYAKAIGADIPEGDLPCLLGHRWEINKQIYDEFLEILPPLGWKGDTFYMSEFTFGDITTRFTKEGDKYYCEFAHYRSGGRQRWDTPQEKTRGITEPAKGGRGV